MTITHRACRLVKPLWLWKSALIRFSHFLLRRGETARLAGGSIVNTHIDLHMADYHIHMSNGSRKGGQSAAAKMDYISREGKYAKGRDARRIVESMNMPSGGLNDPADFWRAADDHERANARLFTEVEFSLPVELDASKQLQLVRDFAKEILPDEPLSFAIHEGKGANPHCHLIFSQRGLDGHERNRETFFKRANKKKPELGGTAKSRRFNFEKKGEHHSNWLCSVRETCAVMQNDA